MTVCAIKLCRNYKGRLKTTKHTTYHQIPNDPVIRDRWIDLIRKSRGEATWKPAKTSVVCSDHFRSEDMYTVSEKGRRRLKKEAVPSKALFLSSRKFSESEDSNNIDIVEFPNPSEGPGPSGTSDSQPEDRVSICEGIKAEDIIASVYNYLQEEYEQLKSSIGGHCDLSPLANILARTAAATGVSELAVSAILEQKKRSADEETLDTRPAKRAKLRDYGDGNVSPITDDEASCDASDKEQDENKQTQGDRDKPTDPLQLQMSELETDSAVQHLLSNISTTTINTQSLDVIQRPGVVVYPQNDSGVLRVISIEPMTSLATVKTEPDDDPPDRDKPTDPLQLQMSELETDSAVQHLLSNISTTTINTQSLDVIQRPGVVVYPQNDSGVLRVISIEPMTSLATVKTEPDDDPPDSQEPDEFGVETLKVEINEEEETDSAVQHILTNISTTTINTQSLDVIQRPGFVVYPQTDSGGRRVISIEPMTSLASVKTEPDDDPPDSDTPSSDAQFEPTS